MAEIKRLNPYEPDNLMRYHLSLSLVESMEKRGMISRRDTTKLRTKIIGIYHLSSGSIYAA